MSHLGKEARGGAINNKTIVLRPEDFQRLEKNIAKIKLEDTSILIHELRHSVQSEVISSIQGFDADTILQKKPISQQSQEIKASKSKSL